MPVTELGWSELEVTAIFSDVIGNMLVTTLDSARTIVLIASTVPCEPERVTDVAVLARVLLTSASEVIVLLISGTVSAVLG